MLVGFSEFVEQDVSRLADDGLVGGDGADVAVIEVVPLVVVLGR